MIDPQSLYSDPRLSQVRQPMGFATRAAMPGGGGIPNNSPLPPSGGKGGATPPPATQQSNQPNMNTMAANGVRDAMGGARDAMNYRPSSVQAGGYNPATMSGQGYNGASVGSQGYGAAQSQGQGFNAANVGSQGYNSTDAAGRGYAGSQIGAQANVNADNVAAGQLAKTDLSAYTNPYDSQVIDNAVGDLDRARKLSMNDAGARATAAGAFGGSRHGLMEAETNKNFYDSAGKVSSNLRQQGFMNAQNMANTDIGRTMQADLANQGANMQANTFNANLGQQRNLANQSSTNQANQFSANAANQASSQNAAQRSAASQFGAGAANRAASQSSQQQQAANMFGAQAANNASQFNANSNNQASQFGAQAANNASLANQASANAAGQFNANAQNAANANNMNAYNQAGQFNSNLDMQAQLANQQAGLQGAGQSLSSANSLGSLSNLGFGMGQTVNNNMARDGMLQQALMQQLIGGAQGQMSNYNSAPYNSIGLLSQALGASPVPESTTQSKTPGMMDYATIAAQLAMMSDVRLKNNITQVGKLNNGINLYTWEWNDIALENNFDTYEPFGVLAQEVELIMPSAVSTGRMGYKQVDYGQVYGVSK